MSAKIGLADDIRIWTLPLRRGTAVVVPWGRSGASGTQGDRNPRCSAGAAGFRCGEVRADEVGMAGHKRGRCRAGTEHFLAEIGRASCRARVEISVVAVSLKKKQTNVTIRLEAGLDSGGAAVGAHPAHSL